MKKLFSILICLVVVKNSSGSNCDAIKDGDWEILQHGLVVMSLLVMI